MYREHSSTEKDRLWTSILASTASTSFMGEKKGSFLRNNPPICYVLHLKSRSYPSCFEKPSFYRKLPSDPGAPWPKQAIPSESELCLRHSLGGAVGLSRFQRGWRMSSNTPSTAPRPPTNLSISLPNTSRIFLLLKGTNYSSLPHPHTKR